MIYLWFAIIIIACYLIGNINFARILAWKRRNQDITTKGSHNPGTINMLRVYGFKIAFGTMVLEFIKGGVPALIAGLVMDHFFPGMFYVAYLTAGLSAVLGQIFPVIYGFKGGKGLATCAGIFFFSPLWWIGLILFVVNFIELYYTSLASVATLSFITEMGIATTIYLAAFKDVSLYFCKDFVMTSPYWWVSIILVWVMVGLIFFTHRGNLKRLIHRNENKIDFAEKLREVINKKGKPRLESIEKVEEKPEAEIIVDDEKNSSN